ncbi:MAG: cyclic nucleotide-binding domain-containing protein [Actinomycetota bacterium]|nr:cyclic nucleotide-binding domain-containing protein [Actinomycetota bacterium]
MTAPDASRYQSSVLSVSWLPSEAVRGLPKIPFGLRITHYDDPPPDVVASADELEALQRAGRFRFANELRGWIDVENGRIVGHGQSGGGLMGLTRVSLGPTLSLQAVALPEIRHEPEIGDGWVRFQQTAGGRAPLPAPRTVARPPFVQLTSPLVWTTLSLTLHADGSAEHGLTGASSVPRHWVYDAAGRLSLKSGLVEFKDWYHHAFGKHSPWGDEDSPAVVTQVETALERALSLTIMRQGAKPTIRGLEAGATLVEQGQPGQELYLLLDGVLGVEVDGNQVVEVGPGAILGERAILEGGLRTATLRAVTPCRVAVASADAIDRSKLMELSLGHRREDRASE